MYAEFYGLISEPFHVTPDPSRLFMTEKHKDAVGAVLYGIMAGKGFVAITGDVGVGKTTVLRYCLDRLAKSDGPAGKMEIVYVLQPALTPLELFKLLHREMIGGSDAALDALSSAQVVQAIQRHLFDAYDHGRSVVVVVDEAQNMPVETLESFRTLSNLETNSSKLLQIVLVGQTELDVLLARHELRQLDQRIAARAYIPPMTRQEAKQYIAHRLSVASHGAAKPFTRGAISFILAEARGNARRINMMCDNALMNGYGHRARRVTRSIARQAIRQLDNRSRVRPPRRIFGPRLAWAAAVVAGLIAISGAGLGFSDLSAVIDGAPNLLKRMVGLTSGTEPPRAPTAPMAEVAPAASPIAVAPPPAPPTTVVPITADADRSMSVTAPPVTAPPVMAPPATAPSATAPPATAPVAVHATAEPAAPLHTNAEKPRVRVATQPPRLIAAPPGSAVASPCGSSRPTGGDTPVVDGAVHNPCPAPRPPQAVHAQVTKPPPRPKLDAIGRPIAASAVEEPSELDVLGEPPVHAEAQR